MLNVVRDIIANAKKKNCLVVIQIHLLQIMNQNAKIGLVIHHTII